MPTIGLVEVHRGEVTEVVEELVVAEPAELPGRAVEVVALPRSARGGVVGDGADEFVVPVARDAIPLKCESLE